MTRNACLFAALAAGSLLGLTGAACRTKPGPAPDASGASVDVGPSALRLYIVSDLAGALEPCGCVRDQLGGLDHAAAWITAERGRARASALVSAGPLFFLDPTLEGDRRAQELAKARTLASALATMGFVAFAPGRNDFAAGPATLGELAAASGASALFANADGDAGTPLARVAVKDLGGVKVGFVGVAAPDQARDVPPAVGLASSAAIPAVKAAEAEARARGAEVVIALAAVGRGEAKRIAEAVPTLTAVVVGGKGSAGDMNSATPPLESIGEVRVIETGNHLQTLAVLDFDRAGDGRLVPRYQVKEVREGLGQDPKVHDLLLAYYARVNEENRVAFAGRVPRAPAPGESGYVGVGKCATCHAPAVAVWEKTGHARAYETLTRQHKEFNLDCVSCHVTGYDRPGGSTVTHVNALASVQCEVCHGPGGKHAAAPSRATIVGKPSLDLCLSCHHPPHVNVFDPKERVAGILGPGHGQPMRAP